MGSGGASGGSGGNGGSGSGGSGGRAGSGGGSGGMSGTGGSGATGGSGGMPAGPVDPGPVYMRRLTNTEYDQTVVDLLGEPPNISVRMGFDKDPRVHGFDNNAEVETISNAHAEQYGKAADAIASAVVGAPARRSAVIGCDPAASDCLRTFVTRFGRRAYRRPLTTDEVSRLVTVAGKAAPPGDVHFGYGQVIRAILQSPHFLFRVEIGTDQGPRSDLRGLTGYETATRLSYFLLGTTPSDRLLDLAQSGALNDVNGVEQAALDLLGDGRAKAVWSGFSNGWMGLYPLPDLERSNFSAWTPTLASSMAEETRRLLEDHMWRDGASLLDVVSANHTFVNAELAALYKLPAPSGGGFGRVELPASMLRAGILTHASILAANAKPERPSSILRGQFVRESLLCTEIPEPPPGVADDPPKPLPGESERDAFKRHTTDPTCESCHKYIDPIGWGLSNFDSIGAFRTVDIQGQPIDSKGYIEGFVNPEFDGPLDLVQRIRGAEDLPRCVSMQLMRWMLGRREVASDDATIQDLQNAFQTASWSFRGMVVAMVRSDAFRYRRTDAGGMP